MLLRLAARKIGRYLLLEGGPDRFVAYDPELGRKLDLDAAIAPALRRRAQKLAQLVHDNVVRIHDVGTHDGGLYVAFDHVAGESLRAWIAREQPTYAQILTAFIDAAEGLAAAHRVGLVHGNVSLDTLLRDDEERVRVTAFLHDDDPPPPEDAHKDAEALARALTVALDGTPHAVALPDPIPPVDVLAARWRELLPRRRSRRWAWSFAAAALVAVGFAAQSEEPKHDIATSTYCAAFEARLEGLWNPQVEQRLGAGVRAVGPAFAAAAWDRTRAALDARVEDLAAAQARDCARTGEAEAAAEAVSLCLHRRFESLRAFLDALEEPNATMVAGLDDTIATLGTAQECEAIEGSPLVADVALPQLLELEIQLSDAKMLRSMGKAHAAITAASTPLRLAESLDARYYVAEAEFLIAESRWDLDDREAIGAYHRAFAAALASEHDMLVARSALSLSSVLAEIGRTHDARRWVDHAAAAQERTGDARTYALIEITRGEIDYYDGDYAAAQARLGRALQDLEADIGPSAIMRARQLHAVAMQSLGDPKAAAAVLAAAVEAGEQQLGGRHPVLVATLISLAEALHEAGNLGEAAGAAERAVSIGQEAFGAEHYGTLKARMEWMSILDASGHMGEAGEIAEEVLATARRMMKEDDARYPGVLDAVGRVYFLAGRQVDAVALLRDAVRLQEAAAGKNHPKTLILLGNLIGGELGTQQYAAAETTSRDALERFRTVFGPEHPRLIGAHLRLAAAVRGQGRPADAIPLLESALELAERHGVRGQMRGAIEFHLAVVLDESQRDRGRALELARAALRTYAEAAKDGWGLAQEIDDVRAFLNERETGRGRRR